MALTITYPDEITPSHNPIIISAVSDVSDKFTIGSSLDFISVGNDAGFAEIVFDYPVTLLKGDYIFIAKGSAPGAEYLEGVSLIIKKTSSDTYTINKPFQTNISSNGQAYKYLNNYTCLLKFYIYVTSAPTTAIYVASKTIVPKFVGGFCYFEIDVSNLVKAFNFEAYDVDEVLSWDLRPIGSELLIINNHSFVKWGVELFEAFDNPSGGLPEYQQEITAEV